MKYAFFLISGVILGLWIAWPGIISYSNWECFYELIEDSKKVRFPIKALLEISPRNILKGETKDNITKLRIVSDACFR
tara:strand:+ start:198 stop:431 length:234 start_codon:yes stop_codon:yes gene_type:complete